MNRKSQRSSSTNPPRGGAPAPRGAARSSGASAKKSDAAPAPARKRGRPRKAGGETVPEAAATGPGRLIRRYGNRRLYDAQLSRCVTMEEIAAFVRAGEELRVVDADSGADITKRVLVQIILEEQNRQQLELLPVSLLRAMLANRSEQLGGWLEQYLAAGADWLDRAMKQVPAMAPPVAPSAGWQWPFGGLGAMGTVAGYGPTPAPSNPSPGPGPGPSVVQPHQESGGAAPSRDPDAELRRRLEELERTMAGLRGRRR